MELLAYQQFFAIGINFRNTAINTRGHFSLTDEQQLLCVEEALATGFSDFIILHTCNRTEIYGIGDPIAAAKIVCQVVAQPFQLFEQYKFEKRGQAALQHIFEVAAGLDSQILGDYEVLGQFKTACKLAKKHQLMSPYFERLTNTCVQASKLIKTKTDLSKGTVSVSFAAVEVLLQQFEQKAINVLLIGTGSFGQNVAKNIRTYLPSITLTVCNRTIEKATQLAKEISCTVIPYTHILDHAPQFDAIIVCAAPSNPLFTVKNYSKGNNKLLLDLTVPASFESEISRVFDIPLMGLDIISSLVDQNLEKRKLNLPIADEIITLLMEEFTEWVKVYEQRDLILHLKNSLLSIMNMCPHLMDMEETLRNKMMNVAINQLVQDIKQKPTSEISIESAIQLFIQTNHNILTNVTR